MDRFILPLLLLVFFISVILISKYLTRNLVLFKRNILFPESDRANYVFCFRSEEDAIHFYETDFEKNELCCCVIRMVDKEILETYRNLKKEFEKDIFFLIGNYCVLSGQVHSTLKINGFFPNLRETLKFCNANFESTFYMTFHEMVLRKALK